MTTGQMTAACGFAWLWVSIGALPAIAQDTTDGIYQAIRATDIAALRAHLKATGANARDKHGSTPLMYAAALGNLSAMQILLDAGADVNAANAFDATALMWCAPRPEMVGLLLDRGADVNAKSKMGRTP